MVSLELQNPIPRRERIKVRVISPSLEGRGCLESTCYSLEPCLMVTGKSDGWIGDGHGALHLLSATKHYANLLDNFLLLCY